MDISVRRYFFGLSLLTAGILLASCLESGGPRFDSEYFEFAKEADSLQRKAVIKPVPKTVDDDMVYYRRRGVYQGRQVVLKGVGPRGLITHAYGMDESRTIWNVELPDTNYIAEIIVLTPNRDSLRQRLRQVVNDKLGVAPTFVERREKVLKMEEIEGQSITFLKSDGGSRKFGWDPGQVSGEDMDLGMLRTALANVPMLKDRIILQEDSSEQRYDIDLQWKKGSLTALRDTLRQYGLDLTLAEEKVEMLLVNKSSAMAADVQ